MEQTFPDEMTVAMQVVAAVIRDDAGRLLLQQRPAHKHHGGQWEFPGGKVEPGETHEFALAREIEEELGLSLDPACMSACAQAQEHSEAQARQIELHLYHCAAWTGVPEGREGQLWGWFSMEEAAALRMPPMDRQFFADLAT
ncbi:8-oxo-dGTP diphosphatase [Altererythrobacter atlanticus]|nr:(deoxy)nucleoside triphosphate pyrophosphohydrolase [Croceibacterium atlanticum]MBB5733236.1 8-oxo-dGTP diphosphatase [Croceibacterium atlanticum]